MHSRYLIQVNRRTISHGVAIFEVLATSETDAMQQYVLGKKHEVDSHISSTFDSDTDAEIVNVKSEPLSLLDIIEKEKHE